MQREEILQQQQQLYQEQQQLLRYRHQFNVLSTCKRNGSACNKTKIEKRPAATRNQTQDTWLEQPCSALPSFSFGYSACPLQENRFK